MAVLDEVCALSNPGSLLSEHERVVAPYDLEVTGAPALGYQPLAVVPTIRNANVAPFRIDYDRERHVHVINGMGVTLGDSIIGLTALHAIKRTRAALRFTIYRPAAAPDYVKQLYKLAAPLFGTIVELPVPLDAMPATELKIDLGNHLFWKGFTTMPMVDFFLDALGVQPEDVPAAHKTNGWLASVALPPRRGHWPRRGYTLFCPTASTPVRSIPLSVHESIVDEMWHTFEWPVLGFGAVSHPRYTDISALSPDTAHFLAWVANARYVVTADSAAVHIAAGYDVDSTAFFTTIAPSMRVRDYPRCDVVQLRVPELDGIHASSRPGDLARVERAYREVRNERFWLAASDGARARY